MAFPTQIPPSPDTPIGWSPNSLGPSAADINTLIANYVTNPTNAQAIVIAGGATAWTRMEKALDTTRNLTTDPAPATDADFTFPMLAGVKYQVNALLLCDGLTAGIDTGIQQTCQGPAVTMMALRWAVGEEVNGAMQTKVETAFNYGITATASGYLVLTFTGIIQPSANGNFLFQWTNTGANPNNMTMKAGSFFEFAVI